MGGAETLSQGANPDIPLLLVVDETVGPLHPDLIATWRAAGVGGTCARCGGVLLRDWCGPACESCLRDYDVARGCLCGGTMLCQACVADGATNKTGCMIKCEYDCDGLCHVCCPDG